MKKLLVVFAFLAMLGAPVGAHAISISAVNGTVGPGSTFTVTGASFLDKSPAAPLLWAPFDTSAAASPLGRMDFTTVQSMAWSASGGRSGGGMVATDNSGTWTMRLDLNYWTTEGQKNYECHDVQRDFVITGGGQNYKVTRKWAVSGYPNFYAASSNGRLYVEKDSPNETGFWSNFNSGTTGWTSDEWIWSASSALGVKDGTLSYRVNNNELASGTIMTRFSQNPDYMVQNYLVHEVQANKSSWSPPWDDSWRVRADNVYADNTWARCMLGNASTYDACTKVRPQIPTAWSSTNANFSGNTATFNPGDHAFLYMIDKNGTISAGFAVTIGAASGGGGGPPPPLPPPAATSLSPAAGPISGNTLVTLTGSNIVSGCTLTVDGTGATVTFVNSNSVTFRTPPHAAGNGTVILRNPDGQVSSGLTFNYVAPPSVTAVTPTTFPTAGGRRMMVNGVNLLAGGSINIAGTPCTGFSLISSTAAACLVPAKAAGTYGVTYVNPDGQASTLSLAVTFVAAPVVTTVTPSTVNAAGGGVRVMVNGSGFATAITFSVAGSPGTGVAVITSTAATFLVPAKSPGAYALTATNPDGQTFTLSNAITYGTGPTVSSVSPVLCPSRGGAALTITGLNFSTTIPDVRVGGLTLLNIVRVNSTTITGNAPTHAAGLVDITVYNSDGQPGTLAGALTYVDGPDLVAIFPSTGTHAGGTRVVFQTVNAVNGCTVQFGTMTAIPATFYSSTHLEAVAPAGPVGAVVSLILQNPDSQFDGLSNSFVYSGAETPDTVTPPTGVFPWK